MRAIVTYAANHGEREVRSLQASASIIQIPEGVAALLWWMVVMR